MIVGGPGRAAGDKGSGEKASPLNLNTIAVFELRSIFTFIVSVHFGGFGSTQVWSPNPPSWGTTNRATTWTPAPVLS